MLVETDVAEVHLYTPDMYFIKNGAIVARCDGAVEGSGDSNKPTGHQLAFVDKSTLKK